MKSKVAIRRIDATHVRELRALRAERSSAARPYYIASFLLLGVVLFLDWGEIKYDFGETKLSALLVAPSLVYWALSLDVVGWLLLIGVITAVVQLAKFLVRKRALTRANLCYLGVLLIVCLWWSNIVIGLYKWQSSVIYHTTTFEVLWWTPFVIVASAVAHFAGMMIERRPAKA
jgi:hypothetical protein